MKIKTRDFGEIEISEAEIVTFCQPVFGFESSTRYVFLHDDEVDGHFVWLQSVDEQNVRFILVSPCVVSDDYRPELPPDIRRQLGEGECESWLITVIPEDLRRSTVNLKSPIVVNPSSMVAAQVILDEDLPIRFPLFNNAKEEA